MKRFCLLLGVVLIIPACGGDNALFVGGSGGFSDPGILTFPDEGREHVPVGTVIHYNTDPPTSGPHYPDPAAGGFYTVPIDSGFLVHSMEHGGVIIYYNPAMLTASDLADLEALANAHPGDFAQIVAVPRNDPTFAIILTAWTHMLKLTTYDRSRMDGFITLFLGNGPESS